MKNFLFLATAFTLSACGLDVASTAATEAQLKAQEASQAKQQLDKATQQIEAAQKAEVEARTKALDEAVDGNSK